LEQTVPIAAKAVLEDLEAAVLRPLMVYVSRVGADASDLPGENQTNADSTIPPITGT
jgi:hypothetical protein